MARIQVSEQDTVSLFPFLSILACIIGVLTLVISGLTLSGISQGQEDESVKRVDEYDLMAASLTRIEAQLADRNSEHKELQALQKQVADLRTSQKELRASLARQRTQAAELARLEKQLEVERRETARFEARIKALETDRNREQKTLVQLRTEDLDPRIMVLPAERGGGGSPFRPTFVELTGTGAAVHEGGKPTVIPLAKIKSDPAYGKLVDAVKNSKDRQIVLLVRDNAYAAVSPARTRAVNAGARVSMLPIRGDGDLDLSKFTGGGP